MSDETVTDDTLHDEIEYIQSRRVRIDWSEYLKLPRHPAYKFEYWSGHLQMSPRWTSFNLALDLKPHGEQGLFEGQDVARVRPVRATDWDALPYLYADAFQRTPPFETTSDEGMYRQGRKDLRAIRPRVEDPKVAGATVVADGLESGELVGAFLVTMSTVWGEAPRGPDSPAWPTLSWAMVTPPCANKGVGMGLLAAACRALWDLGHRELRVSVHPANVNAVAFYWRCGFRLLPTMASSDRRRRMSWEEDGEERAKEEARADAVEAEIEAREKADEAPEPWGASPGGDGMAPTSDDLPG